MWVGAWVGQYGIDWAAWATEADASEILDTLPDEVPGAEPLGIRRYVPAEEAERERYGDPGLRALFGLQEVCPEASIASGLVMGAEIAAREMASLRAANARLEKERDELAKIRDSMNGDIEWFVDSMARIRKRCGYDRWIAAEDQVDRVVEERDAALAKASILLAERDEARSDIEELRRYAQGPFVPKHQYDEVVRQRDDALAALDRARGEGGE